MKKQFLILGLAVFALFAVVIAGGVLLYALTSNRVRSPGKEPMLEAPQPAFGETSMNTEARQDPPVFLAVTCSNMHSPAYESIRKRGFLG